MVAVLSKVIRVPKADLSAIDTWRIRKDLTLRQKGFAGEEGIVRVYKENDANIWLPRWYGWHFLADRGIEIEDRRFSGEPIKMECIAKLGQGKGIPKDQPILVEEVVRKTRENGLGGWYVADCGTGKTIVFMAVAATLGLPTLIVVHKAFLMRQWQSAIWRFIRIDGKPPRVGVIQQDSCSFGKDVPFAVAMAQSLASRKYPDAFYKAWGLLAIDEGHRLPCATFLDVISKVNPRYEIACTATRRRKDGLDPVFEHTLGDVLYSLRRDSGDAEAVFFGIYFLGSTRYLYTAGRLNRSRVEKRLAGIKSRNEIIVQQIVKAVEGGRKQIIVFAGTRPHLSTLFGMLPTALKRRAGFYVGGRKEEQLKRVSGKGIIFATVQMASEGLDLPGIDCLMMATAGPDVEQMVGRSLRFNVEKKPPLIVDFVDRISGLVLWAESRRAQYIRLGLRLRNDVPSVR